MQHSTRSLTVATGLAMFSMFFGAGNVVFPLALGRYAQEHNLWAMLGLGLTAIAMPFVGVVALALYEGSYRRFFGRLGQVPGYICILLSILLIGPGGAAPRTVTVAYATTQLMIPELELGLFTSLFGVVVFLCTWRPTKIIDILGYVLTPILLLSLGIIIIKGFIGAPTPGPAPGSEGQLFWHGLEEGYKTMDLIGAFFFSHVALLCLKREVPAQLAAQPMKMARMVMHSSVIGALCLAAIYWGVSYLMAFHGAAYVDVEPKYLLGTVAHDQLGAIGGLVASIAVTFACLTTAIALCSVFAEFVQKQIFFHKIGYVPCLIATIVATALMSTLDFAGLDAFLGPVLRVLYPAFIVLTVINIGHKIWGWRSVKVPFAATLGLSLVMLLLQ